jgi:hypothetical protein
MYDLQSLQAKAVANESQVAYLMADISNVQTSEIKEISDSLEALSCKHHEYLDFSLLTFHSPYFNKGSLLISEHEKS